MVVCVWMDVFFGAREAETDPKPAPRCVGMALSLLGLHTVIILLWIIDYCSFSQHFFSFRSFAFSAIRHIPLSAILTSVYPVSG